jgi:hypothetical protein
VADAGEYQVSALGIGRQLRLSIEERSLDHLRAFFHGTHVADEVVLS